MANLSDRSGTSQYKWLNERRVRQITQLYKKMTMNASTRACLVIKVDFLLIIRQS